MNPYFNVGMTIKRTACMKIHSELIEWRWQTREPRLELLRVCVIIFYCIACRLSELVLLTL